MTGLPTSFAGWTRGFFGWFLVGSVLRWRLRGVLRVAIDDFLEVLHCFAQLFDLSTQFADPNLDTDRCLLPIFSRNRAFGWGIKSSVMAAILHH